MKENNDIYNKEKGGILLPAAGAVGEAVRADFPILSRTVYDKPLVYFDNAATTQNLSVCLMPCVRNIST